MTSRRLLVMACIIAGLLPSGALAAKRVALVIGNSTYEHAPILRNPSNDSNDISKALLSLGFEVINVSNANKVVMHGPSDNFQKL